ncbi:MAG: hypothetical protein V3W31_01165 [Thermodesulfobacteriota bacterium]
MTTRKVTSHEVLEKARTLLKEAGYTLYSGIGINVTEVAVASCGSRCTGGCSAGCYTCSPGSSNKRSTSLNPSIQISGEGLLEDIVTIMKGTPQET